MYGIGLVQETLFEKQVLDLEGVIALLVTAVNTDPDIILNADRFRSNFARYANITLNALGAVWTQLSDDQTSNPIIEDFYSNVKGSATRLKEIAKTDGNYGITDESMELVEEIAVAYINQFHPKGVRTWPQLEPYKWPDNISSISSIYESLIGAQGAQFEGLGEPDKQVLTGYRAPVISMKAFRDKDRKIKYEDRGSEGELIMPEEPVLDSAALDDLFSDIFKEATAWNPAPSNVVDLQAYRASKKSKDSGTAK